MAADNCQIQHRAVNEMYRGHHGWLHGWLHRHLGCSDTAADLAQDTFVRVLRQRDVRIREPRAYLTHIAKGLMINHWRRRDIERAYLESLQHHPEASTPSPELTQGILQILYRLDAMLMDLPDKCRRAFMLARLEGWKYADIATELGVSERMVKKYIARATLNCLLLMENVE